MLYVTRTSDCHTLGYKREFKDMLAIIATILIVLWLLGFLAFHISTGLIHVLLVIGIVMLIAHFFRGRSAIA